MFAMRAIALALTLALFSFAAHAADSNANNGTDGARDGFNLNAVVLQPHQHEYGALPWGDWAASHNFFSRRPGQQYPLPTGAPIADDTAHSGVCNLTDAPTADSTVPVTGLPPTKTTPYRAKAHPPRDSFTYACPTSVQCADGGCCQLGDYCAIVNGQLGCCPIGSECDASPIPGCTVSCFGICCDVIQNLIGEHVCSATPGEGGQLSGICTGVEPTSPLYTPPSYNCNKLSEFACGAECCPNGVGLICDNSTIPGSPFCNIPDDVDPSESVTTDTAAFTSVQYNTTALSMLSITLPPAATANANATATGSTAATTASMATTTASGASKTTTVTTAGAASKTTTNPTASFSSAAGRQKQGIWCLADAVGTAIGGVVALLGGTLFALL